jgi:hypothetical protein
VVHVPLFHLYQTQLMYFQKYKRIRYM